MPCHGKIIVIKRSGVDGTHFPLTAATCLFGRKSECDIRIQLPHVSKEHCKVEVKDNGQVFVTNLSSVNPTQLNGNALKQPVRLKHGDIITIIDRSFRFENPQSQGRRRSTGLDSENFMLFASNQSDDTNETVRIENIASKVQRKSEGNLTRTTQTRRSLQTSSLESKKSQSPFGELYEMLKSKVEPRKKDNGQTPVKESSSSPKHLTFKKNFQAEVVTKSPSTSRRDSRRSHSSDSTAVQSKDTKVEPRSASADHVRDQSKSPSRGLKAQTKQMQANSVEVDLSVPINSTPVPVQNTQRRLGKSVSSPQEQVLLVSPEKKSPKRSRNSEEITSVGVVSSPTSPSNRRSRGQSAHTTIENQENSPLPIQSPKGRRSGSKVQTKGTPTSKPVEKEENMKDKVQGLATRKSPKKRRSDDLGLTEPPLKRKRVSFGGHLSPELFDKRLPPNSPLKKGATPARRSLSLNTPRALARKSFGLKQTVIKEGFELSSKHVGSPLVTAVTPTRRASTSGPSQSSSKSPLSVSITPVKNSPNKRTPSKSPSFTPLRTSPSTRSPVISKSKASEPLTPAKRSSVSKSPVSSKSPVKSLPLTPVFKSPVATSTTPAKRSPSGRKSPIKSETSTPAKLTTPVKRSPGKSPASKSPSKLSTPSKRSPGRSPSSTPAKKSPSKLSSPSKRSPGRSPSSTPAKKSPSKLSTPSKRSPGRSPSFTPAKKTPSKWSTPSKKRSPGRSPSSTPAKKSQSKLSTPNKMTPGTSSTPGKRSPGRLPSSTPVKKSPVKLSTTPVRRSPAVKSPKTPTSTTLKKSPASVKKSPSSKSPAKSSPATPYTKGRFSVSRVDTPPQAVKELQVLEPHTPKPRKSLSSKKTPHRRSRKLDAFESLRARRRSGASEANLLVAKSWADIVKIGVAKPQKKIGKAVKVVAKKKPKPKTPARRVKDLSSTGHADSPVTILVGRAHTRTLNFAGYVPKIVRNEAVKLNPTHNESFTGVAELFSTPVEAKQRRSSSRSASKADTPKSSVEMSVMQTPEEAGEMVVSPLNSPATARRKQYGRDAVSRLLSVSGSPEISEVTSAISENTKQEASNASKDDRKSVGLTGIKRLMRTPKQKGKPIADPHALRKLLKTPKEAQPTQAHTRRSANLEVLGIAQLVKTPKHKGEPVEDMVGIKRILKTPKQKGEPVEDYTGVKRVMQTPKERGQPVEDMVGIKRIMRTPKERGEPVEDMVGIKQLMRSPKDGRQPVKDIDLSNLLRTPSESTNSTENTRPIEEIFGIKNLVKTPPKKSSVEQVEMSSPKNASEALKSVAENSGTPSQRKRGRPSKRLSLPAEATTTATVNDVQKTLAVAESEIAYESAVQSEVINSSQKKKGRPSKSLSVVTSTTPEVSAAVLEITSPSQRGKARTTPEVPNMSVSEGEVTSPVGRRRSRSTILSPVEADYLNLPSEKEVQKESVKISASPRRGRPRSSSTFKDSVTEATLPTQSTSANVTKESLPASDVVTSSSSRGGRHSVTKSEDFHQVSEGAPSPKGRPSNSAMQEKDLGSAVEMSSPSRRGRSSTTVMTAEPLPDSSITSPSRRGRPRKSAAVVEDVDSVKISSPPLKSRSSTSEMAEDPLPESAPVERLVSPSRRGRPSSSGKLASPSPKGKQNTTSGAFKDSDKTIDLERPSASRRGKPQNISEQSSKSDTSSDKVVPPPRRGRLAGTAKESVPAAQKASSSTRRGRLEEQNIVATAQVHTKGRSLRTVDTSLESVSSASITSQTRRGRSRDSVEVSKASVEATVTSTVKVTMSRTVETSKESSVDQEELQTHEGNSKSSLEPVLEVTSPRRGRPKTSLTLSKETIIVTEETSTTRRTRGKTTDTSQTRRGSAKSNTEVAEVPVPAASVDTSTRRGRPKTAFEIKETISEQNADVTSMPRGRTKVAEEPKVAVPEASASTLTTRKGRSKAVDVSKEDATPRKGRSKNIQTGDELATVSEVTSPKPRGRSARTTEKKADLLPEMLSDANKVTTKTDKRAVRLQNVEELPQEAEVPPVVSNISDAQPTAPSRRGRGRKAVQKDQPSPPEDVADIKAEEPKLKERRGQSNSKTSEETVDLSIQASSPTAKYVKRSSRNQKDVQPEPAAGDLTNARGRSKRILKDDSAEQSVLQVLETAELPKKRTPTKGRPRTRNASDVSAEEPEQPESRTSPAVLNKRGRRKNQESTNEISQAPTERSRVTRGKRGLSDEQPSLAAEVKKKTTVSNDSAEHSVGANNSKAKSVQWHPLLTTNGNSDQETTIASARGNRSKSRTMPEQAAPVKRLRRENDVAEHSTISKDSTAASSTGKGRRGRNAAASSKTINGEINEVVDMSSSRGKRDTVPDSPPAEKKQIKSPPTPRAQKKYDSAKESSEEAGGLQTKQTRGVKRRNPTSETSSSDATANHNDAENTTRGRRNARNTKGETATEEKQMVSSPAKRRKTEAATGITSTRGKSREPSKVENVKPLAAAKVRARTRSRK